MPRDRAVNDNRAREEKSMGTHAQDASAERVPAAEAPDSGLPLAVHRAVVRYSSQGAREARDEIATEYALTVYVNDREFATLVCSPGHLEDLVVGFLASEGVVSRSSQIRSLEMNRRDGSARVRLDGGFSLPAEFYGKRRFSSCCGKNRPSFYFLNDALQVRPVRARGKICPAQVFRWMEEMDSLATLYWQTGGVHIACLASGEGIVADRADVGRHNALDKIHGHALRTGLDTEGCAVAFSGRLSSEVILKVAKIGSGVVAARSAPTALAVDLAEELGVTAIGFARDGEFNVYSHSWRLSAEQKF